MTDLAAEAIGDSFGADGVASEVKVETKSVCNRSPKVEIKDDCVGIAWAEIRVANVDV